MSEWFIWTTVLWAFVVGWGGSRVLWWLCSRREYLDGPR
jgi:hypothetical protein